MIALFSSNEEGGMLQYLVQIFYELVDLGYECSCFLPSGSTVTIPASLQENVIQYKKIKTINSNSNELKAIEEMVLEKKPDVVWYADSSLLSSEICQRLKGKVYQIITVHDPITDHPTNNSSFVNKVKNWIVRFNREQACKVADAIVLPSASSLKKFCEARPQYANKAVMFPLGAHIPMTDSIHPEECQIGRYFLFFGRIDKYKGIETILRVFQEYNGKAKLVIAGKGEFTEKEKELLGKLQDRIILIKRYIEDGEMIWLFENAIGLVLPYIEASQSGIIPIAYKFGKPVMTSNIEGLTQFVVEKKTGFVCNNKQDWIDALLCAEELSTKFEKSCKEYYCSVLDWKTNITRVLNQLEIDVARTKKT